MTKGAVPQFRDLGNETTLDGNVHILHTCNLCNCIVYFAVFHDL